MADHARSDAPAVQAQLDRLATMSPGTAWNAASTSGALGASGSGSGQRARGVTRGRVSRGAEGHVVPDGQREDRILSPPITCTSTQHGRAVEQWPSANRGRGRRPIGARPGCPPRAAGTCGRGRASALPRSSGPPSGKARASGAEHQGFQLVGALPPLALDRRLRSEIPYPRDELPGMCSVRPDVPKRSFRVYVAGRPPRARGWR